MSGTAQAPRATGSFGRYGGDDQRADRTLKRVGLVLGVLAVLAVLGGGIWYLVQAKVSGEVEAFQVVNAHEIQAHLAVDKRSGTAGTCTLSAVATDQSEVGRVTVDIPAKGGSYDTVVTIRTTAEATTAELVSCSGK